MGDGGGFSSSSSSGGGGGGLGNSALDKEGGGVGGGIGIRTLGSAKGEEDISSMQASLAGLCVILSEASRQVAPASVELSAVLSKCQESLQVCSTVLTSTNVCPQLTCGELAGCAARCAACLQ